MLIHEQIRAARRSKGLTQEQLAEAATVLFRARHLDRSDPKIDPSHLTRFELGSRAMSSDKVDCLCEVLGLHLAPPGPGTASGSGCIALDGKDSRSGTPDRGLDDAPSLPDAA